MFNLEEHYINHDWAQKGFRKYCSTEKLMPLHNICTKPFNRKNDKKAWQKKQVGYYAS